MDRQRSGFTLIELLIVVVIIGILAAIAIPKFSAVRERAYLSALRSDLKTLANLQEVYYNDAFSFSSDLTAVGFTNSSGVTVTVQEATTGGWSALAEHAALPTDACAIYHGDAAAVAPAATPSMVQCTR